MTLSVSLKRKLDTVEQKFDKNEVEVLFSLKMSSEDNAYVYYTPTDDTHKNHYENFENNLNEMTQETISVP